MRLKVQSQDQTGVGPKQLKTQALNYKQTDLEVNGTEGRECLLYMRCTYFTLAKHTEWDE